MNLDLNTACDKPIIYIMYINRMPFHVFIICIVYNIHRQHKNCVIDQLLTTRYNEPSLLLLAGDFSF